MVYGSTTSDTELVSRVRKGDTQAYATLWWRHSRAARAAASAVSSTYDPDDVVQEAFTSVFAAIRNGGGPTDGFRPYLLTAVRNTAAGWGRAQREYADEFIDERTEVDSAEAEAELAVSRGLTARAFRSLPHRWQEVLWYTEVEEMRPRQVAPLLGMKPGAVGQLAFRAREGLREAWISAHLRSLSDKPECHWVVSNLGAFVRGGASRRDAARIDDHLGGCAKCSIVASEAGRLGARLAMVLLPAVLGATGATGYLAHIRGSDVSTPVASQDGVIPRRSRNRARVYSAVTAGAIVAVAAAGVAVWSTSVSPAPTAPPSSLGQPSASPGKEGPSTPTGEAPRTASLEPSPGSEFPGPPQESEQAADAADASGEDAALPPAYAGSTTFTTGSGAIHAEVTVRGEAGATVAVSQAGVVVGDAILNDDGVGKVTLDLTRESSASFDLSYLVGGELAREMSVFELRW